MNLWNCSISGMHDKWHLWEKSYVNITTSGLFPLFSVLPMKVDVRSSWPQRHLFTLNLTLCAHLLYLRYRSLGSSVYIALFSSVIVRLRNCEIRWFIMHIHVVHWSFIVLLVSMVVSPFELLVFINVMIFQPFSSLPVIPASFELRTVPDPGYPHVLIVA